MARIRTIKPEFWEDEKLGACSVLARLTFIGLVSLADDEGRGRGTAVWLRARLHAFACDADVESVHEASRELVEHGLVIFYEADGQKYYWVKNFARHQKIDRPNPSKLPAPVSSSPPEPSPIPRRAVDESSPPEGNGMEWKGMEGNGMERKRNGMEGKGMDRKGKPDPPSARAPVGPAGTETPGDDSEPVLGRDFSVADVVAQLGLPRDGAIPRGTLVSSAEHAARRARVKAQLAATETPESKAAAQRLLRDGPEAEEPEEPAKGKA